MPVGPRFGSVFVVNQIKDMAGTPIVDPVTKARILKDFTFSFPIVDPDYATGPGNTSTTDEDSDTYIQPIPAPFHNIIPGSDKNFVVYRSKSEDHDIELTVELLKKIRDGLNKNDTLPREFKIGELDIRSMFLAFFWKISAKTIDLVVEQEPQKNATPFRSTGKYRIEEI